MAQSRSYKNYLRRCRRQRPEVREKERQYVEKYIRTHPDYKEKKRESDKKYYDNNKTQVMQKVAQYNARSCNDPVVGDVCRYNTLVHRIKYHPELYEGVIAKDCLIKVPVIKGVDSKLKEEYNL